MWVIPFWLRSIFVMPCPPDCTAAIQGVLATAQRSLRSLQPFAQDDLVLRALIPGYSDWEEVEVPKESWPIISAFIQSVTISLQANAARA